MFKPVTCQREFQENFFKEFVAHNALPPERLHPRFAARALSCDYELRQATMQAPVFDWETDPDGRLTIGALYVMVDYAMSSATRAYYPGYITPSGRICADFFTDEVFAGDTLTVTVRVEEARGNTVSATADAALPDGRRVAAASCIAVMVPR